MPDRNVAWCSRAGLRGIEQRREAARHAALPSMQGSGATGESVLASWRPQRALANGASTSLERRPSAVCVSVCARERGKLEHQTPSGGKTGEGRCQCRQRQGCR